MNTPAYRETQSPRQLWIWIPVSFLSLGAAFIFVRQLLLHHPVGTRPMPDAVAWVILPLVALGLPLLLATLSLTLTLEEGLLDIRFFPFLHRRIPLDALAEAEATSYHPIQDYGGWGIRRGPQGWAYTVSGHEGVRLRMKDGKTLLLGSRRSQELARAIREGLRPESCGREVI